VAANRQQQNQKTNMKRTISTLAALACGFLIPVSAETTTETQTDVTRNADGSTTMTETTTTTFTPEVETKVVKYFDAYKANPHGLPPAWSQQVKVDKLPSAWKTTRITTGTIIPQAERDHLFKAPAELIEVLPEARSGVTYYVAGSNVVAVDSDYKVVDSIRIPTIKFSMD
jgi:hypothetical protein